MYLDRESHPIFQSIILAGVYDIKNLKLNTRPEEQHQYNSPWNIAMPFDVDMSLSAEGIAGMLAEYKADHELGFDHVAVAFPDFLLTFVAHKQPKAEGANHSIL